MAKKLSKLIRMTEYVEEFVRSILAISETDPIPEDISEHVTRYQYMNDKKDKGKISKGEIEHCINTMGQEENADETPAQRKARAAKLQAELDEIRKTDDAADDAKKEAAKKRISPEPEPETETKPEKKGKGKGK